MSRVISSLQELYLHKLQTLVDTERLIALSLPLMIEAASHADLQRAFHVHLQQTEEQERRLEPLLADLGHEFQAADCPSIRGIIEEGQLLMKRVQDPSVRDAALIASAQAVEHHEIAAYGTARAWALQLGLGEHARVLERTLREEEETDRLLTELAERLVNHDAEQRGTDRQLAREAMVGDRTGTATSGLSTGRAPGIGGDLGAGSTGSVGQHFVDGDHSPTGQPMRDYDGR